MNINKCLYLSLILCAFSSAQNAVPVVDLAGNAADSSSIEEDSARAREQSSQYYQMQVLQEEVRQLRGLVEELNYQLQQLRQRQMDDYLDIDRRLSKVASGTALPVSGEDGENLGSVDTDPAAAQASAGQAKAHYDDALKLLLQNKDIDGATNAFKQHVVDYPQSPYVVNAWYWLGEISVLKGATEEARQAFTIIIDQYADHSKAMDARFKLGKVYFNLGDKQRARELMEVVAEGEGSTPVKARAFLGDNY